MSKPFSELTKDFSRWRKFKAWIEKQKILWDIRKKSELRREGYLARREENLAMMEEFKYVDAELWAGKDE